MKNKILSKRQLIQKLVKLSNKIKRKPQKRDSPHLYYYSRKLFGSWNNLLKAAGYKVRFNQNIKLPHLDENFAYFLGLVITDGTIYVNSIKKSYKISIYNSYSDEKDMIVRLVKALFDNNPPISSRMYGFNKKPNYEIRIESKKAVYYFIDNFDIPSGKKSLTIRIPKKIMNANSPIKKAFVRGVIDGDGSILKDNIKVASGSYYFLEDLKKILKSISIDSGKIKKDNKMGTVYSLRINKAKHLMIFQSMYSNTKSTYARKKEKIGKV